MVYVIVHKGTKKGRLRDRCRLLNRYVNKELRGPGERGKVYDFSDWASTKTKSNSLGNEKNGSKMKERSQIKEDLPDVV